MKRRWGIAGGMVVGIAAMVVWMVVTGAVSIPMSSARAMNASEEAPPQPSFSVARRLSAISPAIPLYSGADYRKDLSASDLTSIRTRHGNDAEVYTLVSRDGFPMVWHYYVTYLAQFRGWRPDAPFPNRDEAWRALELDLTDVMRDPFIPGESLEESDYRVILEVQETAEEIGTVIRYVVVPKADRVRLARERSQDEVETAPAE